MTWENLAILSSERTLADPSTVALWLFLCSRCKRRYIFSWLLDGRMSLWPQMCSLINHTVNYIVYPVSIRRAESLTNILHPNVHMDLTYFVWKNNYDILWRGLYKHEHSLHGVFSFQLCLSLKFQQDLQLLCFFNLFILWVCPHFASLSFCPPCLWPNSAGRFLLAFFYFSGLIWSPNPLVFLFFLTETSMVLSCEYLNVSTVAMSAYNFVIL